MARANVDDGYRHMVDCCLCQRNFQFGPHRYAGRGIGVWKVRLCEMCLSSNHDGIVLEVHPRLKRHLEALGVTIALNRKGWLDIPH